ncbi:hypothetical protein TNIN_154571 [Trichonephila inaurata madagascariensis]|uniref:Uncharacterized protein n=1 Tax=Trichonephila inaurata madagascariensis TaxID=2747483 RepID=A0A8X7CLJ9_9ARAC|nr:hypothetical protein TNIN_154571 [Trichonephila inaurata madagascariensis]
MPLPVLILEDITRNRRIQEKKKKNQNKEEWNYCPFNARRIVLHHHLLQLQLEQANWRVGEYVIPRNRGNGARDWEGR